MGRPHMTSFDDPHTAVRSYNVHTKARTDIPFLADKRLLSDIRHHLVVHEGVIQCVTSELDRAEGTGWARSYSYVPRIRGRERTEDQGMWIQGPKGLVFPPRGVTSLGRHLVAWDETRMATWDTLTSTWEGLDISMLGTDVPMAALARVDTDQLLIVTEPGYRVDRQGKGAMYLVTLEF
ncbi:hypothetical protein KIPB_007047 [Kipferlia bialata]|uniref:Uncharacterized protein n=1 Tax=Kipferlia bialata TaxID=797122 RepID=A0A9K3GIP7_9EUKA|nr:hypothetical protein KIPB_007047 [Kipferlia bialata]|eukprot:g7047.t1